MKVIFLDCDGVINSEQWFIEMYERYKRQSLRQHLCLKMLDRVANIVKATGAKIVLSSSWRHGFNEDLTPIDPDSECSKLLEELKKRNCELVGKTGYNNGHRATEIKEYLDAHPEVSSFIIIDDDIEDIVKPEEYRIEKNKDRIDYRYYKKQSELSDEELLEGINGIFSRGVIIQTFWKTGITDEDVKEAIEKLSKTT